MIETLQLSEEFTCGPARLRVDVHGSTQLEHVLEDMNFLNYRLAEVHIAASVSQPRGGPGVAPGRRAVRCYDGRDDLHRRRNPGRSRRSSSRCSQRLEGSGACIPFHASAVR